jgi:MFS superfamily sulfate permease-like transporter
MTPASGRVRADVLAGTTAAAVVIPQAMGYVTVAGLPVQVGLYTCIVPMVVYAVLGGSRRLSFSTTSTIVALTALALSAAGASGADALSAAATLTLLTGIAVLVFRLLRLGWLVETVSDAVVAGLKFAVAFTIIADQLPKLLGIRPADGRFGADVAHAFTNLGSASGITVVLSVGTIGVLVVMRRWAPRVPGPLLAVVAGIALVWLFDLGDRGVAVIPDVPTGLPLPAWPSFEHASVLLPYAVVIAIMSCFETVTAARLSRQPDDPPLDNNHECAVAGVAALAGGLFQTVPPAGGFSQTQVNANAGARTQLSELVTAGWALLIALLLAPVLRYLPEATLGAIVVMAVAALINVPELARLRRIDPVELGVAVVTLVAALAFNLLVGVIVGVALTYYLVLRALNHPVIVELRRSPHDGSLGPARAGDEPVPGMLILRIEGGLYTLNIRRVQTEVYSRAAAAEPQPRVVLLDVGGTSDTSVTVLDVLAETHAQLARRGVDLWVAALPTRALAKAQRTAAWDAWASAGRLHRTVGAAVAAHLTGRRSDDEVA